MKQFEFTLAFRLADFSVPMDLRLERLAEARCDDALAGIGHPGQIALAFSREGQSARDAVLSALTDVRTALPDARLIEASPDLVGLTDVAEIMGFTRQNMRKLMIGSAGPTPAPLHGGKPSLWHLAHVLRWLRDGRSYPVDPDLLELAEVTMQLNIAADGANADAGVQREIRAALQ